MVGHTLRRAWLRSAALAALAGLGFACQAREKPAATAPAVPASQPLGPPPLALTVANSELVVGQNRFLLAVLENGRPVPNAAVNFEFFELDGQNATKRSEADATYRSAAGDAKGFYVARTRFDRAGKWGVQVTAARLDQPPLVGRTGFEVLAQGSAPPVGSPAIPSRNPTAGGVAATEALCSAQPPCDMHALSIAEALALRRPLLISFSTPGYCTSQTCAPVHGEVQKVKARRGAGADFVHVEIYKEPRNLVVADTVNEWHLKSEPWVFVVDRNGTIADRIESVTNAEELEASLAAIL